MKNTKRNMTNAIIIANKSIYDVDVEVDVGVEVKKRSKKKEKDIMATKTIITMKMKNLTNTAAKVALVTSQNA